MTTKDTIFEVEVLTATGKRTLCVSRAEPVGGPFGGGVLIGITNDEKNDDMTVIEISRHHARELMDGLRFYFSRPQLTRSLWPDDQ